MSVWELCVKLEGTAVGTMIRESLYGFPIVVAIHILGLALSVGTLVWFDLRLAGVVMQRCRVSEVYRQLAPWLVSGFVVMFVTGTLLFVSFATSAYENVYFRIKLVAMVLAAVNALVFHFRTERAIATWDAAPRPPLAARAAGLTSIAVWFVVILAGRMMSYTMF